jgi:predicted TIM-barrel fold metal-dependent hydrolase
LTGSNHENLAKVIARHPDKFVGFYRPRDIGAPETAEELRHAVEELGLRGLKLLGPRVDFAWDDPRLAPVWRYLAEKRLPALIHFGPLGKAGGIVYHQNMNPLTLYPVAKEYQDIDFVIPHFGCGYPQELLQLMWSCPNVHVDTSGSNQWMEWMPYPFDLASAFRKFYETVGPKRIIFGTDSSWFPRGFSYRYLQDQVRVCRQLNFHEADMEQIFARNALRLLGLPGAN